MDYNLLLKVRIGSFMEHKQTKVAHKALAAKWNQKFQFQLSQEDKETRKLGRVLKYLESSKKVFAKKKLFCPISSKYTFFYLSQLV